MSNKEQSKSVPKNPATFRAPKNPAAFKKQKSQPPVYHNEEVLLDFKTCAECVAFDHALGKSEPNK